MSATRATIVCSTVAVAVAVDTVVVVVVVVVAADGDAVPRRGTVLALLLVYVVPPLLPVPPDDIIFVLASSMQSLASRKNASIASTFLVFSAVSAMMIHVAAIPATTSSADMLRKVSMT